MKKLLIVCLLLASTACYAVEPDYNQANQEYAQYQRDMVRSSYSTSTPILQYLPALLGAPQQEETPADSTSTYQDSQTNSTSYQETPKKNPVINSVLNKVYNFVNE